MPKFDGVWEHEKTQHALVILGSAALAAAVTFPRYGGPSFPKGIIKCIKKGLVVESFKRFASVYYKAHEYHSCK